MPVILSHQLNREFLYLILFMVFELDKINSIANHFLTELRDKEIQSDRLRFRNNLERLGEVLAYEVSKELDYNEKVISSSLGNKKTKLIKEQPVLVTIMRAGLPFFAGFINYFDHAPSGFIGAYRVEDGNSISIESGYLAMPKIEGKEVILVDPMLATGKSIVNSIDKMIINGVPKRVHIVAAIAAPEGIDFISKNIKVPLAIWVGSIDERLDQNAYIVPGLGDAGDLSYGGKMD